MAETARLIIPVWGEAYVAKVLTITLPAALAPGNLPALSGMFDVEVVIVTESRLFDLVRNSRCFQAVENICRVRLVSLDDLLAIFHADYGTILTYALFRGFVDLGARMTETYLLFLCADFIVSDGSLRRVGQLMSEGKRLIHAPSFRVKLEDVWPRLQRLVDTKSCTLSLTSRDMVTLALAHKHPTVTARTVNQRLRHQSWMDQFYWYVDESTLIGYQSPMALVAIKPERVAAEPKAFWDYGFIPEAAPTLEPYFITDSDDFFMMEPQGRDHQSMLIRIGWVSTEHLARTESLRATKEHRVSLKQLLKIHASDLPADLQQFVCESRGYMAKIYAHLSPNPAPHVGHPLFGWRNKVRPTMSVLQVMQRVYRRIFGSPPNVGKFHPLWLDTALVQQKIAAWKKSGKNNVLSITSANWPRQLLSDENAHALPGRQWEKTPFDACVCELPLKELSDLESLYLELRPLTKDGGHILFKVANPARPFEDTALFLGRCRFPDIDVSEMRFYGTLATALLRAVYFPATRPILSRPIVRTFGILFLILFAPVVWLANARAERRDPQIFSPNWVALTIQFTVRRARMQQLDSVPPSDPQQSY